MKIEKALQTLDDSWSRKKVLNQLQNGLDVENIINDFIEDNQEDIIKLVNYISPKEKELLKQIEELSNCEAQLINKINNYKGYKNRSVSLKDIKKHSKYKNNSAILNFCLFINRWGNTFVVIALIAISAIALTKQAWA